MTKNNAVNVLDNPNVYEQFDWRKSQLDDRLKGKIDRILAMIPNDVKTILDVGCGDGAITNRLALRYNVLALDRSLKAIGFVKTGRMQASAESIPIQDNSFDMVFSSELLEHITENILFGITGEMTRLTKKYLFITVPNNESIEKDLVQCPSCDYVFQRSFHLRNWSAQKIEKNFPDFRIKSMSTFGIGKRGYNHWLAKIKHRWVPAEAWIPHRWAKDNARNAACPKCEMGFTIPFRFHWLGFLCDTLNMFLSPHRPYWLFVLLEKEHSG